jgi:hypothetical protein
MPLRSSREATSVYNDSLVDMKTFVVDVTSLLKQTNARTSLSIAALL